MGYLVRAKFFFVFINFCITASVFFVFFLIRFDSGLLDFYSSLFCYSVYFHNLFLLFSSGFAYYFFVILNHALFFKLYFFLISLVHGFIINFWTIGLFCYMLPLLIPYIFSYLGSFLYFFEDYLLPFDYGAKKWYYSLFPPIPQLLSTQHRHTFNDHGALVGKRNFDLEDGDEEDPIGAEEFFYVYVILNYLQLIFGTVFHSLLAGAAYVLSAPLLGFLFAYIYAINFFNICILYPLVLFSYFAPHHFIGWFFPFWNYFEYKVRLVFWVSLDWTLTIVLLGGIAYTPVILAYKNWVRFFYFEFLQYSVPFFFRRYSNYNTVMLFISPFFISVFGGRFNQVRVRFLTWLKSSVSGEFGFWIFRIYWVFFPGSFFYVHEALYTFEDLLLFGDDELNERFDPDQFYY